MITKSISDQIGLNENFPYVEVDEIKKNSGISKLRNRTWSLISMVFKFEMSPILLSHKKQKTFRKNNFVHQP